MEIQIGDRFTDEEGEWEIVSDPATLHGAKSLRTRVQRPGQPATERDVTWPASRARRDSPGFYTVSYPDLRYLPSLLPWLRVLFLIRSITSTEWMR